jgi:hypothetical protein
MPQRAPGGAADGPVFVDPSGRRARALRRIGVLLGIVSAGRFGRGGMPLVVR